MVRALTSCLWIIAALALGFESVAQPCEMTPAAHVQSQPMMASEMPCHDDMADMHHSPDDEMPQHTSQTCCCAALLGNLVSPATPQLTQPVPVLTNWASPLPDFANSIFLEFEPPPPRG